MAINSRVQIIIFNVTSILLSLNLPSHKLFSICPIWFLLIIPLLLSFRVFFTILFYLPYWQLLSFFYITALEFTAHAYVNDHGIPSIISCHFTYMHLTTVYPQFFTPILWATDGKPFTSIYFLNFTIYYFCFKQSIIFLKIKRCHFKEIKENIIIHLHIYHF